MLHRNRHSKVVDLIDREIQEASKKYPCRYFGRDIELKVHQIMNAVKERQNQLKEKGQQSVILREEPFTIAQDSIAYKIYLMIWKQGILNRKVVIEEYPVSL